MKTIFIISLWISASISLLICKEKKQYLNDIYTICGTSYQTSELLFEEDDQLTFRLRFVYFADSMCEVQPNYDSITKTINEFYQDADIKFDIEKTETIVDSDIKYDMPSFVKYHYKNRNDSTITCYIYGNKQTNFTVDNMNTMGAAGGVGSNFFAIRSMVAYSITPIHELGHCFSLIHVDAPDDSGLPYSTTGGDKICDTKSIINIHEKVDHNCIFHGEENLTEEEKQILICNFMSWNFYKCRGCMTEIQVRRIRFYIHESPMIQLAIKKGLKHEF